jgi:hypothetical protein
MKENYTGIERLYDKDRFFYYVYVDGQLINKFVNFSDAENAIKNAKKQAKIDLFKIAFASILDKYKVNMTFIDNKIDVTFDNNITPSFTIDGNEINSEVFKVE